MTRGKNDEKEDGLNEIVLSKNEGGGEMKTKQNGKAEDGMKMYV